MEQKKGKVYIVGAGPGDPELITVKAMKCLARADVILYDRLVNPVLLEYGRSKTEVIYCGKTPGDHCVSQDAIHQLLVEKALAGKTVVRLKGGDPFIFGRGGEEAEVLVQYGIEFEVVPGITSGIAVPAYAGIPVTHREFSRSFAMVTGHCMNGEPNNIRWDYLANGVDTLAVYMGIKHLPYICSELQSCGKDAHTPIAVIEQGTTDYQRTVIGTLETIVDVVKSNQITNPAMIVIGEVVKLSNKLSWIPEKIRNEFQSI
ncbi:uroporphyrinogen-III C-methyltransferase [Neobacillus ginsengisoli]|uniref:uroporphyrinogen-III C-methyltransferase n=1 Tax=Neobacillus ginsengisoli TaxID=904295 RepID=A0ABT9XWW5_9BACI|nr:uroporphyrinogen-III C-methyltransferase [Neobacillus ginsengisoli]MDQ0199439.1 uroporphyrin-III C-methyltransferase [Neobacillus ginsengisoli]